MLYVEQYQIGDLEQLFVLFHANGVVGVERIARSVRRGVNSPFLEEGKQLRDETDLKERLAARDGDAPLLPEIIFIF